MAASSHLWIAGQREIEYPLQHVFRVVDDGLVRAWMLYNKAEHAHRQQSDRVVVKVAEGQSRIEGAIGQR